MEIFQDHPTRLTYGRKDGRGGRRILVDQDTPETLSNKILDASCDVSAAVGAGAGALSALSDVVLTSLSDSQILRYDSGSGKWVNSANATLDANGAGTMDSLTLPALASTLQFGSVTFDDTLMKISAADFSAASEAHKYLLWADVPGVRRIKLETDGGLSDAWYNPLYPKYTPVNAFGDATQAFERAIVKWDVSDVNNPVIAIGSEWGPTKTATSITRSSSTATVTLPSHGYRTNDVIAVSGADQTEYNVSNAIVTVTDADTFTYTVSGTPDSPATGTISVEGGQLRSLVLSSGVVQRGFTNSLYGNAPSFTQEVFGGTPESPADILPNISTGGLANVGRKNGVLSDITGFEFFSTGGGAGDTTIGGDFELYLVSQVNGAYHYWNWYSQDATHAARPAFNVYDTQDAKTVAWSMNAAGDGWIAGDSTTPVNVTAESFILNDGNLKKASLACPSGQSSVLTVSVDDAGVITFAKVGCS